MKVKLVIIFSFLISPIYICAQLLESKEILLGKQTCFDAQFFNHETQLAVRLRNSIEVFQISPPEKAYCLDISATALATASQSDILAVATSDGKVQFFSGDSLRREFDTGNAPVMKIVLHEDSGMLACWNSNTEVSVWSIHEGLKLQSFPTEGKIVTDMVFSTDGSHLLLATSKGTIIDWQLETGFKTEKSDVHEGFVRGLAIHPDGERYASCGDDGLIVIHSLTDSHSYTLEKSHSNFIMDVEFLDDNMLLGVGHDHLISFNNINTLPDSASVRNYFYLARQDKFAGDKYPNSISVSNKNSLIGISTLGKGVILSSHFHDFINYSYKLDLGVNHNYAPALHNAVNKYESNIKRCAIVGVINRVESIKSIYLVNPYTDTKHAIEVKSNGGFSIDVNLYQKDNPFELVIEDIDPVLKPVSYSMIIRRL